MDARRRWQGVCRGCEGAYELELPEDLHRCRAMQILRANNNKLQHVPALYKMPFCTEIGLQGNPIKKHQIPDVARGYAPCAMPSPYMTGLLGA